VFSFSSLAVLLGLRFNMLLRDQGQGHAGSTGTEEPQGEGFAATGEQYMFVLVINAYMHCFYKYHLVKEFSLRIGMPRLLQPLKVYRFRTSN
jgi:hypothetical protein